MKKFVFVLVLSLCALWTQAASYPYLVFTNTAGTLTAMDVTDLTLTVSGTNLQVSNSAEQVTFVLTDLSAMQFSVDGVTLAVDNILRADSPIRLFTPAGICIGSFESLRHAAASCPAGTDVISDGSNSQTIVIQ